MRKNSFLNVLLSLLVFCAFAFSSVALADGQEASSKKAGSVWSWMKEKYEVVEKKVKNKVKEIYKRYWKSSDNKKQIAKKKASEKEVKDPEKEKATAENEKFVSRLVESRQKSGEQLRKIESQLKKGSLYSIERYESIDIQVEPSLKLSDWSVSESSSFKVSDEKLSELKSPRVLPLSGSEFLRDLRVDKRVNEEKEGRLDYVAMIMAQNFTWTVLGEDESEMASYTPFGEVEETVVLSETFAKRNRCDIAIGLLSNEKTLKKSWQGKRIHWECLLEKGLYYKWLWASKNAKPQELRDFLGTLNNFLRKMPTTARQETANLLAKNGIKTQHATKKGAVQLAMAEKLIAQKKWNEAKKWLDQKKGKKTAREEFLRAVLSVGLKKNTDAKRHFLAALKNKSELHSNEVDLAYVNAARLHFQTDEFSQAIEKYRRVGQKSPHWIDSIIELGWAQIRLGHYKEAVGNMYSLHTPFFESAYKPESFVVRTIGYLGLCQYPDAYKSLTFLEKRYSNWKKEIDQFLAGNPTKEKVYSQFLNLFKKKVPKNAKNLPPQILREVARRPAVTGSQKQMNNTLAEKKKFRSLGVELSDFQRKLEKNPPNKKKHREFYADLYKKSRSGHKWMAAGYGADSKKSLDQLKEKLSLAFLRRLKAVSGEIGDLLDNNELLRFEVFSGSGEDMRRHGLNKNGQKRVLASSKPKTRKLQWAFEGEIWLDEIGHFSSSLKSNCPKK